MKRFLMSKPGLALILVFTVGIAFLCQRILSRNTQRRLAELRLAESAAQVTAKGTGEKQAGGKGPNPPQSGQTAIPVPEATPEAGTPGPSKPSAEAQEDLASMDRTKALSKQSRLDKDRQGRGVTRRKTPASITKTTALAGSENGEELTAGGPSEAKGKRPR